MDHRDKPGDDETWFQPWQVGDAGDELEANKLQLINIPVRTPLTRVCRSILLASLRPGISRLTVSL
jgi:hypothetical protein